ncbi:MAG: asparagine synthase (glutamine-hydrolyzing), partial [Verrucomicrobia bacterium]|nr:asparagine synthase (glutamine-hydrolyzing) [Verrucomicrobiota bacterium]
MCGIAGMLNFDGEPTSPAILRRMTDAIRHRGPDGEGQYCDGPMGLGHRRLAILDLSPAGHQPMMSPDGRYVLSYNGEIYNFQELRTELEAAGCTFRSRTDTEVLLSAWQKWGERCLTRFNGMFAFALWDRTERELVLARDRYGIKPLYWGRFGESFIFASEIKAILGVTGIPRAVDREGLLEYFTFQNFFTPRTLFKGVSLLPAGHLLRVRAGAGAVPASRQWWDFCFEEPTQPASEEEYAEELDRLFRQAVRRQLVSDVEVGSYLSGGMDSGSITAMAARDLPNLKTFTCGFDLHSASGMELQYDEREAAEFMSYKFRTEHYEMVLKAGDMERCLPRLAWHLEEPRVGQSYPNFYIAQLASKFVRVALSGTGGDELFGGYPWRYYRAVVNDDFEHYIDKYYLFWQRLIDNRHLKRVFAPIWGDVQHVWTRDIFRDVFQHHTPKLTRPEDYINHSLYFEAKTFLNGLLVVEDKLSMAHSLETRVPFLDNDLVDFAQKLPVRTKLGNLDEVLRINENEPGPKTKIFFEKTKDGKRLLRRMMERHIPAEIAQREKQGFSAPDASWFKGESIDYVRRLLLSPNAAIYDLLDYKAVKELNLEHIEGRQNRRLLVWSLLNVNECLKQYF